MTLIIKPEDVLGIEIIFIRLKIRRVRATPMEVVKNEVSNVILQP